MTAIIQSVENVEAYGENLSVVTTSEGHQVIANKREDGSFRWEPGELCIYVSEGSIIPDEVLKERGYWDEEKDRGLLDGGKRNRVKMKKLAGFESRGLLFKVGSYIAGDVKVVTNEWNEDSIDVEIGDDVTEFFGITEFTG